MSGPLDCKVYVGNLGSQGSKSELERSFGYYGRLTNVWVARNPPGFAFVEFEDPKDAEDAVRALDGRTICGVRARVELSSGMSRRGGRGGYNPRYNSYGGGRDYYRGDHYRDRRRRSRSRSPRRRYSRSRSRSRDRRDRRSHRSRSRSDDRSPVSRSRSKSGERKKSPVAKSRSRSRSSENLRKTPDEKKSRSASPERQQSRSPSPDDDGARSRSRSRSQSTD